MPIITKVNFKDYIRSPEDRERLMQEYKKAYVPHPCDICGKLLSFEESVNMHMICSTNPKNRFCGEIVFCCDSHSFEEHIGFVMARRAQREKITPYISIPVDGGMDKAIDTHFSKIKTGIKKLLTRSKI